VTCWLWLAYWRNNVVNSHPSQGPFNNRVLRYRPCSPWGRWSSTDNKNRSAAIWADHRWNVEWLHNTMRLCNSIPDTGTNPPWMALPRAAWVWLNCFRTGVGRFCSCLHKGDMAPSACEGQKFWGGGKLLVLGEHRVFRLGYHFKITRLAKIFSGHGPLTMPMFSVFCEWGAEEQTIDHVILQCPIHWPPHGLHGVMVLDDEIIEWLQHLPRDLVRPSTRSSPSLLSLWSTF